MYIPQYNVPLPSDSSVVANPPRPNQHHPRAVRPPPFVNAPIPPWCSQRMFSSCSPIIAGLCFLFNPRKCLYHQLLSHPGRCFLSAFKVGSIGREIFPSCSFLFGCFFPLVLLTNRFVCFICFFPLLRIPEDVFVLVALPSTVSISPFLS